LRVSGLLVYPVHARISLQAKDLKKPDAKAAGFFVSKQDSLLLFDHRDIPVVSLSRAAATSAWQPSRR
jgi:hypothetical protein